MRTFRNPEGPDGHSVVVDGVVIKPGEQADVDLPDWQPCPALLEEVGEHTLTEPPSTDEAASEVAPAGSKRNPRVSQAAALAAATSPATAAPSTEA